VRALALVLLLTASVARAGMAQALSERSSSGVASLLSTYRNRTQDLNIPLTVK
jgi:hypothetical protein